MELKKIVDQLLKQQNRSLSWLAGEMDKTFDGLKLSLVKESIKYSDLKRMSKILKVPASVLFNEDAPKSVVLEEEVPYTGLKSELASCRELVEALKSQLSDKEKIINLLDNKS
ncbi:hypothetical protein BDE36_0057 [Arcticibacter tournemirensis]|uniref:XRE family transcriptional regulator n=1 Tax=Arcticibacter tournemirensis TaxID=699437 RepID=A0A5M9GXN3_9SPHI|nr:hypothetical protein [Arcticibacter tournemirensis]KAA8477578.1 hypothetical protein F1649_18675 [Arcticibacter tournemirensis]TQM48381.1 hypothetical protein BDE36_0057 [Arcticibacter tournemirensis]